MNGTVVVGIVAGAAGGQCERAMLARVYSMRNLLVPAAVALQLDACSAGGCQHNHCVQVSSRPVRCARPQGRSHGTCMWLLNGSIIAGMPVRRLEIVGGKLSGLRTGDARLSMLTAACVMALRRFVVADLVASKSHYYEQKALRRC